MNQNIEFIRGNAPCYVYDSKVIIQNCSRLAENLPMVDFLYSIKTNPFDPVIQIVTKQGFGADASSVNEVFKADAAGITADKIFYSTPGKTSDDIEATYGRCVHIADSFHELELLDKAADAHDEVLRVGVRINPCAGFNESEGSSKFGIDEEFLFSSEMQLAAFEHLTISGVHMHLKSQVLSAEQLGLYYERCYDLAVRTNELKNTDIRFVNFGSGIGMVYDADTQSDVDLDRLAETLKKIRDRNTVSLGAVLYIETGRFVVGNAGKYYTIVTDIKESRGTKYLIVKNGLNGFSRPAIAQLLKNAWGHYPESGMEPLYTCSNEVTVRVINEEHEKEIVTIVGDLCTAQDVICSNVAANKASIGDLIEITNAGSYGFTLSMTQFASHNEPAQLIL